MKAVVGFYVLAAILTFGYASNNPDSYCNSGLLLTTKQECNVISGFVAGMFWPLYWAQEAFSYRLKGDDLS